MPIFKTPRPAPDAVEWAREYGLRLRKPNATQAWVIRRASEKALEHAVRNRPQDMLWLGQETPKLHVFADAKFLRSVKYNEGISARLEDGHEIQVSGSPMVEAFMQHHAALFQTDRLAFGPDGNMTILAYPDAAAFSVTFIPQRLDEFWKATETRIAKSGFKAFAEDTKRFDWQTWGEAAPAPAEFPGPGMATAAEAARYIESRIAPRTAGRII